MNVKEICSGFRYGFMKNLQRIAIALIITAFISCDRNGGNSKITCLPNSVSGNVLAFYPFSKGTLNDLSGNNHHLINKIIPQNIFRIIYFIVMTNQSKSNFKR